MTDQRLAGRVALVIGGVRGIGRGIAERFADEGARVVVADALEEGAEAVIGRLGGEDRARFVRCDIATARRRKPPSRRRSRRFGGLDILVQNAGIYPWTLIEDIDPGGVGRSSRGQPARHLPRRPRRPAGDAGARRRADRSSPRRSPARG